MKAFLTQDVAVFKRYSGSVHGSDKPDLRSAARHAYQQELQKANITTQTSSELFHAGMATQYLQAMPLSPEAAATKSLTTLPFPLLAIPRLESSW